MTSPSNVLLAAIIALSAAPTNVQDVSWAMDLETAFGRSEASGEPVLVSVCLVGEPRSMQFLEDLHREKEFASALEGRGQVRVLWGEVSKRDARRYGDLDVDQHRALELSLRDVLPANADGALSIPNHVWLGANGEVLCSAPWDLELAELLWLDDRARELERRRRTQESGEEVEGVAEAGGKQGARRVPRRFLLGEIHVPATGDRLGRGLLPNEEEEALEVLRKRGGSLGGGRGGGAGSWTRQQVLAFAQLAATDSDDAQSAVRQELGNVFLARSGFGGRLIDNGIDVLGFVGPRSAAETLVDFLGDGSPERRVRAAASLEAMGYDEGWSELNKALRKEEDPRVRAAMLRAAGVVGRGESGARRLLQRAESRAKVTSERIAALIGLGHFGDGEAAEEAVRRALADGLDEVVKAGVVCAALTRDVDRFGPLLRELQAGRPGDGAAIDAALRVLGGAPVLALAPLVDPLTLDDAGRPRLFFESVAPGSFGAAYQRTGRAPRGPERGGEDPEGGDGR